MKSTVRIEEIHRSDEERILNLARQAIFAVVEHSPVGDVDAAFLDEQYEYAAESPLLLRPGAAFVTLSEPDGSLRGCIGSLQPQQALWRDIIANARSAAVRDPRFPPLKPAELDSLQLEVSVLGAPQELAYATADELAGKLRPDIDGVVLSLRGRRATFLPQVWQRLPTPTAFLNQLCRKAGLPSAAWQQEHPQISVYQVRSIGPEPLRYAR